MEDWIQHWMVARFLYDWQTLTAGVLAVLAAVGGTIVAVSAARREVKAMRLSLAVEIRHLVNVLLQAHENFGRASSENKSLLADDVAKEITRGVPVVFPAMADRIGLLGFRLAPYVLIFYANLKQLEHAGRIAASMVEPPVCRAEDLRVLMKLIADACRENVLPLLSKLPRDKADTDTERKAKIEAMG